MVKIVHDREKCIGCGSCVAVCPEQWEMDSDGKSKLKDAKLNPSTGNHEIERDECSCDQEAVNICPVKCIHIV